MSPGVRTEKLLWQSIRSVALAHKLVPDVPGIYAYSELAEFHGLAVAHQWIYIGQALSLPTRLARHQVRTESNRQLRDWLHRPGERQLWYAEVDPADLDRVERDLIARLQPRFNRTRYLQHAQSA
ncbi:hypothetical protein LN042_18915 [Kitasatospora sp. RB6PN24]|uniref:hypothetical protein n=1 Tax=Kitasatospora humi TaxID=2893891 RepID=UPI001E540CC6|nr:hypothetical protein [Kitasatospora humi]MCC9309128.1 hypothetical protein [Kitasatospora humi]